MGMTDSQFKAYIRALIYRVKKALEESPDNMELQMLLSELQAALED